ncbi:MAG: 50S ribosomal protein L5 [Candidatus Bathyarchaeota archaeon]|jgi:large subunit ribosomal protein L5|nr:50S ribosomal protein L5 [Candidatus Bathyarchaeota archaeon]
MSNTEILNPMQTPRIAKVIVNIAVGRSGETLQRAMTVVEQITGQNPCRRTAKRTIREWGIHRNEPIACLVTLRGIRAHEFLKKAFNTIGDRLKESSFDSQGNFAFGFDKHIDMPGVRYDPNIGIFGMNVCVAMTKAGYRVVKRHINSSKIGKKHKLHREEAIGFIQEEFGIEIIKE